VTNKEKFMIALWALAIVCAISLIPVPGPTKHSMSCCTAVTCTHH
jgi:hypothetical protein